MNEQTVVDFANGVDVALGAERHATEDAEIYRKGKSEAASHYIFHDPTHTEYLWYDGPYGRVGISNILDVDTDLLGCKEGTNVLGTTDPLSPELDPEVSWPFNLVPYDRVTASKLILAFWMKAPGETPLYAKKPMGRSIYRLEHRGAFQFRWLKATDEGVAGRANLNLLDNENRATVLRLVQEMHHGHFLTAEEAGLLVDDLVQQRVFESLAEDAHEGIFEGNPFA